MDITDHPGYLGYGGIVAIHADWPTYPSGVGPEEALLTLGNFPRGTILHQIDDIDRCALFLVGDPKNFKDPFGDHLLHVALWDSDLIALAKGGMIDGVIAESERDRAIRKRKQYEGCYWKDPSGNLGKLNWPDPDEYEDDFICVAHISDSGIAMTAAGADALHSQLMRDRSAIHQELNARCMPLLQMGRNDAAIREACILLEVCLRSKTGTQEFGQSLVATLIGQLQRSTKYVKADLQWFRVELLTAFKYVRNEFAHNFKDISGDESLVALAIAPKEWVRAEGGASVFA